MLIYALYFPIFLAEDAPPAGDEEGFKDLIKFWKRHGIPIPKDLISDMADEKGIIRILQKGRQSQPISVAHY